MRTIKFIWLLFFYCASFGQRIDVKDVPGHLKNYFSKPGPPDFLNDEHLPAEPMKSVLLKLTQIVESTAHFGEPKGYDLNVRLAVHRPIPGIYPLQSNQTGFTWMALHEFYRNDKGEIEVNHESGAGITVMLNDLLGLFPDGGNAEMDEYHVPRFVRAPLMPVTTDEHGYLHLAGGVVVLTNGNPLFIPYTQEQYLTYLIKQKQKIVETQQETKSRFAKFGNSEQYDKAIKDAEDALHTVQLQLKNMNADERKKPAYIYFTLGKNLDNSDPAKLLQLTTPDDPYAELLITPNPKYFTKNAIQLISVIPEWDARFVGEYYIDIIKRVMEQLDYSSLKQFLEK